MTKASHQTSLTRLRTLLFCALCTFPTLVIPSQPVGNALPATTRIAKEGLPLPISTLLSTQAGTIVLWVNPDFDPVEKVSHTLLSARWSGEDNSYLVISDGWWEPEGAGWLYFVLSNEDEIHCKMPYDLPRGEWSMLAVTWSPGRCAIYVDGAARTSIQTPIIQGRQLLRMTLGDDDATTIVKHRIAPGQYARVRTYDVALSAEQLAGLFDRDNLAGVAADDADWRWLDRFRETPERVTPPNRRNIIFDEGHHWGTSRTETDKRLARIERAGFNVYVPTVWYGGGTYYPSRLVDPDPNVAQVLSADDPLAYLIQQAHARGIEVHGSFTVAQRSNEKLTGFFGPGVPPKSYDIHNPRFRDFIVDIVADAATRYPLDGVNLDYIRAIGICTSPSCRRDYALATKRNLAADYLVRFTSAVAGRAISDWQQRAVHDIVSRIRQRLDALGRHVTLSVCFNSVEDAPYSLEGRDVGLWIREGLVDLALDMQYVKRLDVAGIDRFQQSLDAQNRVVVLLANWDKIGETIKARSPARMQQLAQFSHRQWPRSGFGLYLYDQLNDAQIEALRTVLAPQSFAHEP